MQTTSEIYDRYKRRIYKLWSERRRARILAAFPDTGGNELFLHNWYSCGKDPMLAAKADQLKSWDDWHKIDRRYRREYDKAEHAGHVAEKRDGQYLWCQYCQSN